MNLNYDHVQYGRSRPTTRCGSGNGWEGWRWSPTVGAMLRRLPDTRDDASCKRCGSTVIVLFPVLGPKTMWPFGRRHSIRLAGSATLASSQGKNLFVTLFFRFLIKKAGKLAGAYITCWLRNFQLLVFAHGLVCGEYIKLQRRQQHK